MHTQSTSAPGWLINNLIPILDRFEQGILTIVCQFLEIELFVRIKFRNLGTLETKSGHQALLTKEEDINIVFGS